MPLGVGQGQNVGLRVFCHIMTLLPPGGIRVSQTHFFLLTVDAHAHDDEEELVE